MENSCLQSRENTVTKTLKEIVTGCWFYDTCQVNTNSEIKTNNIIISLMKTIFKIKYIFTLYV
jgi:hypothetical protein